MGEWMNALALLGIGAVGTVVALGGAYAYATLSVATPDYTVVAAEKPFEVRDYPPLVVAETIKTGNRGAAVRAAFSPLAGYIFAKERAGEKIAMTAPVTQSPSDGGWTVAFIMPAGYTLSDLPTPAADIRLSETPAQRMAAIRFSGSWSDERFAAATDRLKA